jgi:hypothetical protein
MASAQSDGALLRQHLRQTYPSLAYADRYRRAFPKDVQGSDALWNATVPPDITTRAQLVEALTGLEDQHVALAGQRAGATESLGTLFRTSSADDMIVWRVFDRKIIAVKPGDVVLKINGVATKLWLEAAARATFGGNRRSRAAEAALELGLGTRAVHQTVGLGEAVTFTVQRATETPHNIALCYARVDDAAATAMTAAVNSPDLPRLFTSHRIRIGTLRLGAFAPQYDKTFKEASDAAAAVPGTSDDQAMVAGFCAVVHHFIASANDIAAQSDVLVLDLRGNMGGFGREARLLAQALAPAPLPASFDVFATGKSGLVQLKAEPEDAPCGHVKMRRPLVVLTDAGTRSAGELMAAWLWGTGVTVVGERTIGAGGGFEFGSAGFELPRLGYAVRTSGNFTLFDTTGTLIPGEFSEAAMIDTVAAASFSPSRDRYFAIQAVGLRPDVAESSTLEDLRDGGVDEVGRIVARLKAGRELR